jgi:hypothetical protein
VSQDVDLPVSTHAAELGAEKNPATDALEAAKAMEYDSPPAGDVKA